MSRFLHPSRVCDSCRRHSIAAELLAVIEDISNQQGRPIMAEIGKYKLADAIRQLWRKAAGGKGGRPVPTHETATEQIREGKESEEAGKAGVSSRDRMVDIGRGNQQAGRQGQ